MHARWLFPYFPCHIASSGPERERSSHATRHARTRFVSAAVMMHGLFFALINRERILCTHAFVCTHHAHQLKIIIKNSRKIHTCTSINITSTCKVISSNLFYIESKKKIKFWQNYNFKTVRFFLRLKYNKFDVKILTLGVILLKVHVWIFLDFLVIIFSSCAHVYTWELVCIELELCCLINNGELSLAAGENEGIRPIFSPLKCRLSYFKKYYIPLFMAPPIQEPKQA